MVRERKRTLRRSVHASLCIAMVGRSCPGSGADACGFALVHWGGTGRDGVFIRVWCGSAAGVFGRDLLPSLRSTLRDKSSDSSEAGGLVSLYFHPLGCG